MKNQTILITGALTGIGRATSERVTTDVELSKGPQWTSKKS